MSSVAKGFNCFAAEAVVPLRCHRGPSLLANEEGNVTDGEVERLNFEVSGAERPFVGDAISTPDIASPALILGDIAFSSLEDCVQTKKTPFCLFLQTQS